jgi:hypothetical protein
VRIDVPLLVSLVAVIVAVPTVRALTTPLDETVATVVLLELHVTTRSVTTVPFTSLTVGVGLAVWPTVSVIVAGSDTLPTGARATVTAELPFHPPLEAVTNADPGAMAVTTPLGETAAADELFETHVTTRSVTTVPLTSLTVVVSGAVWPTTSSREVG